MVGSKGDVADLANYLNAKVNPSTANGSKAIQTAQR
jgi:hypothetical protein